MRATIIPGGAFFWLIAVIPLTEKHIAKLAHLLKLLQALKKSAALKSLNS